MLKAKRLELPAADRVAKSKAIQDKLASLIDWEVARTIHCFEPIESLGEVDVFDLFNDKPNVFVSRKIDNEWQIVSLNNSAKVPKNYDLIIVPMLGFDDRLHRIGYGGGYYDKFLSTQPKSLKIGVCFEIGHIDQIPAESYDIPLDKIVTEEKIYT